MDQVLRIMIGIVLFIFFGSNLSVRSSETPKYTKDEIQRYEITKLVEDSRLHFNDFALDPVKVFRTFSEKQFFVDSVAWEEQKKYGVPMYIGAKKIGTRYSKEIKTYFTCAEREDAVCYAVMMNNFAGKYIKGVQSKLCSQKIMEAVESFGISSLAFYVPGRDKPLATCTNGMFLFEVGDNRGVI